MIQKLKYFLTIVDEGNLTKASKKLHTVPSNVTVKLKHLEENLGHILFTRSKKGMSLTPRGLQLVHHAREIVEKENAIKQMMKDETQAPESLSVAALDTFVRMFLADIIPEYIDKNAGVKFELQTGFNADLFSIMSEDRADFIGVIGNKFIDSFEVVFSYDCDLHLLSNDGDFESKPLIILSNECFIGQRLADRYGYDKKILKISSIESAVESVRLGIGITLLPSLLIKNLQSAQQLFTKPMHEQCTYSLVRKAHRPWKNAEKEFVGLAKSNFGTQ